jgi:hypothetical protein
LENINNIGLVSYKGLWETFSPQIFKEFQRKISVHNGIEGKEEIL